MSNNISKKANNNITPKVNNISKKANNNLAPKANNNLAPKANNNIAPKANNNIAPNPENTLPNDASKSNNTIVYVIIFIVIILVVCTIIYFIKFKKTSKEKNGTFIEKQASSNQYVIEGDAINLPKDGFDYTVSFWIYIDNYYENYNTWRHVMHKGNAPFEKYLEHSEWSNLTQEIQEQSPGIWLHPNKNNIRLAFTTEVTKEFCEINKLENTCIENDYCEWDGLSCSPRKKHPYTESKNIDYNKTDKKIVEYLDLVNLPTKTMVFIGFTLNQKILNVYINDKLFKTKKFLGTPFFNKDSMYFNIQNTYGGFIYNFNYIPYRSGNNYFGEKYNNIPNIDKFPKMFRIKKFLSQLNFKELFKTITI